MAQTRYLNYFTDANASQFNTVNYALHNKGVYRGMDLVVDTGKLYVDPGISLQPDGVVWQEDVRVQITFVASMAPALYTVVATHDNRQITGGVGVLYALLPGTLTTVVNGIVLGWVYYPGGGVTLLQIHVQSAPKALALDAATLKLDRQSIELIPPYPRTIVTFSDIDIVMVPNAFDPASTPNPYDLSDLVIYQGIINNGIGIETLVQQIQFYVNEAGVVPYSFDFYFRADSSGSGSTMTVEVHDTNYLSIPVTGSPVTGDPTGNIRANKTVLVDQNLGTFDIGKPYTLRLTFTIAPGKQIQLGRIRANFWPYP